MKVFCHHIYEYKKGLRNLILCTIDNADVSLAISKLYINNISYQIWGVSDSKTNIFFGNSKCIDVINSFGKKSLKELTLEQDFILGTMLGYDRLQQCDRYLNFKKCKYSILKTSTQSQKWV